VLDDDVELDADDRLLKAYQVAEMLQVTMNTVLRRFEAGDLPGFRLWGRKGGPVRFRRSEIEALLESWRMDASTGDGSPNREPSE